MTSEKLNTEQLIKHCRAGNQLAQLEIYNRYYKAMYNASLRILKDSFEAEDIMQDSFLTAFSKLDTLQEDGTFGPWLKRIVINNSIYRFKQNNKNKWVSLDDKIYALHETNNTNSDLDASCLDVQQILNTMNALKDNYRIALSLNLIEGYDYEEISQIMGISYANCRTTISRAKENLRNKLQTAIRP